ncbi:uncharacterized protein LOC131468021 isoform X2 [Solea solea]|uniref:uncharacterized protein LOC131468021 isoform X2 n=1 Tax=Solea solea TaxID=90069 RepID=UPI00272965CA|nr:uncharacterized protein LOC131468021 isoform X2 [Solea solea]
METSLSDLLSDALETSFPDLDFENFNFDGKCEEDETDISCENVPRKELRAVNQEGMAETAVLCSMETKDTRMTANVAEDQHDEESDKEDFQGVRREQTGEEDYASSDGDSEQEGSVSGEDEVDDEEDMGTAEKPGELWMSESFDIEYCSGNKKDGIPAEGQPLAPEDVENTQIRNKEQGENVSIEEESCFGRVPEHSNKMMINIDGMEEGEHEREEDKQEDTSGPACESMRVEQDQNILAQVEILYGGESATESLEFPAISEHGLQDLIVEADSEEYVEKIKEFSGEEHEEAGESFADYPSDFSSCEYVEDGLKNEESNSQSSALPHTSGRSSNTVDVTWVGTDEDTDEQGDGYLYSRDLERDTDALVSFHVAVEENEGRKTEIVQNVLADAFVNGCDDAGETGEADSDSSTDDEELLDDIYPQNLENYETPASSMWSISNDSKTKTNREDSVDFSVDWDFDASKRTSVLSENLLTTEDTDEAETTYSDPCPAEDIDSYSVVQKGDNKAISPSYHGSLDDSFFFNSELAISDLGPLGNDGIMNHGNDRREEKRSWEQEQEIINTFFQSDDDSEEENAREVRQIKVHFCTESLSQVIHYEIESDVDSLSSSTDREEDQSSTETSDVSEVEAPDKTLQIMPGCDLPNTPENLPENSHSSTQICSRKHKCLSMLKLMLKMVVVIAMGLLMFWLTVDQLDWLSQASFYKQ